jgi:hypothetical protein
MEQEQKYEASYHKRGNRDILRAQIEEIQQQRAAAAAPRVSVEPPVTTAPEGTPPEGDVDMTLDTQVSVAEVEAESPGETLPNLSQEGEPEFTVAMDSTPEGEPVKRTKRSVCHHTRQKHARIHAHRQPTDCGLACLLVTTQRSPRNPDPPGGQFTTTLNYVRV